MIEVEEPVTREIIPLIIGKRRIELPLETREECRALIRVIALASMRLPDDGEAALLLMADHESPAAPAASEPPGCGAAMDTNPAVTCASHGKGYHHSAVIAQGADKGTRYSWPVNSHAASDNAAVPYPAEYAPDVVVPLLNRAGVIVPLDVIEGWTYGQRRDAAQWAGIEHLHASDNAVDRLVIPSHVAAYAICPDAYPGTFDRCARLNGHKPPHRDGEENEWGGEPHHPAPGRPRCEDQDEDGAELWLCNAQPHHAGPDHIVFGDDGEPVRTWPVTRPLDVAAGADPFAVPANRIGADGSRT